METVDRSVYFEDVKLQMEAKLWGEEYSRHRPPKPVQEKHLQPADLLMDEISYNPSTGKKILMLDLWLFSLSSVTGFDRVR